MREEPYMTKLAPLAVAIGLTTASCGHAGSALPPAGPAGSLVTTGAAATTATQGARTIRPKSLVAAPAGWANTATGAIAPANAIDLGQLDRAKTVNVVLGLQMRNADAVKSAIAAGQKMSRQTFVSQYAPTSSQVAAAVSYLQSQGFMNVTATPNNMLVTASASAANVEKAFNTSLHGFTVNGKPVFANTQPAFVPSSLAGNVVAVLGLTNVPGLKAGPLSRQLAPQDAIFPRQSQPTPCTQNVNGTTGTAVCPRFYDPQTYNITYEATRVAASGPEIAAFTAGSFAFSDMTVALNRWASDDVAPIMNASVGGCEVFPYESGDMLVADMILVEAAAQGQTLFASTGDTGGYCGVAGAPPNGGVGGAPLVEYPARSPYAVAAGLPR